MGRIEDLEEKIKETKVAMDNITAEHPLHQYFKRELDRYLEQYFEIKGVRYECNLR